MSNIIATETQSPNEELRYLLDYTLDLNTGESLVSVVPTVTSQSEPTPLLVVDNVALAPAVGGQVSMATFFASVGTVGVSYEVSFLATTTLGQVIESVVRINIRSFT